MDPLVSIIVFVVSTLTFIVLLSVIVVGYGFDAAG